MKKACYKKVSKKYTIEKYYTTWFHHYKIKLAAILEHGDGNCLCYVSYEYKNLGTFSIYSLLSFVFNKLIASKLSTINHSNE